MRFYEVEILDDKTRMGKITFKIGRKDRSNETWIYNIDTEPAYQHMGVGSTLLKLCEYMTSCRDIKTIRGRFFPFNEYARPMYEKNGYKIEQMEDEAFFCKRIGIKKTQETVSKLIIDDSIINRFI